MTVFDQHADFWIKKSGIPTGLQRHLPSLSATSRICDLGCAGGRLATSLPGTVFGIDYSKTLVKEAQRAHPGIHFVAGDFQSLQTWAGICDLDLIISNCAIRKDYSPHLQKVGQRCHDALTSAGVLLLRVQADTDLSDILAKPVRDRLFYNKDELIKKLNMFHWTIEKESFRQTFSTPEYVTGFLQKTQLPVPKEINTLRIRRDYFLMKGEKFNKEGINKPND